MQYNSQSQECRIFFAKQADLMLLQQNAPKTHFFFFCHTVLFPNWDNFMQYSLGLSSLLPCGSVLSLFSPRILKSKYQEESKLNQKKTQKLNLNRRSEEEKRDGKLFHKQEKLFLQG